MNTITIDWQMVGVLITLALTWHGILLSAVKILIDRHFKAIDERLTAINRLEQQILNLQTTMPNEYLRRDDWIRSQAVIEGKLDRLMMRGAERW